MLAMVGSATSAQVTSAQVALRGDDVFLSVGLLRQIQIEVGRMKKEIDHEIDIRCVVRALERRVNFADTVWDGHRCFGNQGWGTPLRVEQAIA